MASMFSQEQFPAPHLRLTDDADDASRTDAGLEDAARDEREYLRGRLRDELKREPTEEELNEWLRRHTEGY